MNLGFFGLGFLLGSVLGSIRALERFSRAFRGVRAWRLRGAAFAFFGILNPEPYLEVHG